MEGSLLTELYQTFELHDVVQMFLTKHKYSARSLVVSSQIRSTARIGIW